MKLNTFWLGAYNIKVRFPIIRYIYKIRFDVPYKLTTNLGRIFVLSSTKSAESNRIGRILFNVQFTWPI